MKANTTACLKPSDNIQTSYLHLIHKNITPARFKSKTTNYVHKGNSNLNPKIRKNFPVKRKPNASLINYRSRITHSVKKPLVKAKDLCSYPPNLKPISKPVYGTRTNLPNSSNMTSSIHTPAKSVLTLAIMNTLCHINPEKLSTPTTHQPRNIAYDKSYKHKLHRILKEIDNLQNTKWLQITLDLQIKQPSHHYTSITTTNSKSQTYLLVSHQRKLNRCHPDNLASQALPCKINSKSRKLKNSTIKHECKSSTNCHQTHHKHVPPTPTKFLTNPNNET
eukprot:gene3241-2223_t